MRVCAGNNVRVCVCVCACRGQDDPGYYDYLWDQADFPKLLAAFEAQGLRDRIRMGLKGPDSESAEELLNQTMTASRAQELLAKGYSVVLPLEGLKEVPKDTKIAQFAQGSVDIDRYVLYFKLCALFLFLGCVPHCISHAGKGVPMWVCFACSKDRRPRARHCPASGSLAAHPP